MNIEHISVSRYGVWDTCAAQYRFKYHEKIPIPGEEPFYFIYGKTIHKIAEEYVQRGDPEKFHEVVMDVLGGRVEIEPGKKAPKMPPDYSKRMMEHLKNIKQITNKIGWGGEGFTEYNFRYDLNPPHEHFATGFIDRIIVRGDKYFILDYKTTKPGNFRKNNVTVLKDLQLRMYCKVIQRDFGAKAENIKACLYYVEGGDLVGATYTQASLDSAEEEMREAYRQIKQADPDTIRGNVGNHCRRCDYRKICPFYSLT